MRMDCWYLSAIKHKIYTIVKTKVRAYALLLRDRSMHMLHAIVLYAC